MKKRCSLFSIIYVHSFIHETNIFHKVVIEKFLWFYLHKIDNIASGSRSLQDIEVVGNSLFCFHKFFQNLKFGIKEQTKLLATFSI